MGHSLSFATSALVFLLIQSRPAGPRGWFLTGLAVGFASLMRWPNALLGAAAFPTLLAETRGRKWPEFLRDAGVFVLGAAIGFAPQIYAWQAIFGVPLLMPHGSTFLSHPAALLDVLFSPLHGLLTWSPFLYLAIPGLFAFRRLGYRTAMGFWVVILLLYVTNARTADWWAGSSFGNRRFCTILAPLAVGIAITFDRLGALVRRRPLSVPVSLAAVFAIWNFLVAEGHRQDAWMWTQPVSFSHMAGVAGDQISRNIGSPLALPGSIVNSVLSGQPIADYDKAVFRRPFSTFVLRFGDGDIPFLREGFSIARWSGDARHRSTRDGRLVVPLHRAEDYVLGLRARAPEGGTLLLLVNSISVGSCPLGALAQDCELEVPAGYLRPGNNEVRLRVPENGGTVAPEADLTSFWLKPRRSLPMKP